MADIDADIWVCGECRSINNLRAKQCYRCRTPRDVAAVDPNQIEGTGHGKLREIALPGFQPTRWAAVLASALLVLVAVTQVVATVADAILFGRVVRDPGLLNDPAFYQSVESVVAGTAAITTLVVALLALIAWSFWLSRAVMAMPALGLGYPATNGLMAFLENFLPGLNLFRVPSIVRDVMRRLDPTSLRGEVLIFAAWIGLLGGYLVPRLGAYLGLLGSGTLEEIVSETLLVQGIATVLVVVGATFLVALIWWIERRIARRRAAQLAGELPAEAAVDAVAPAGAVAPAAVSTLAAGALDDRPVGGDAGAAIPAGVGPSIETPAVAPVAEQRVASPVDTIASRAESGTFTSRSITAATGAASTPPEAPAAQPMPTEAPTLGAPTTEAPAPPEAPAPHAQPDEPTPPRAQSFPVVTEEPPAAPEPPLEEAPPPPEADPVAAAEPPRRRNRRQTVAELAPDEAAKASEPPIEPAAEAQQPSSEPPGEATAGPQLHLRVESVSLMIATMDGESEPITLDELRVAAEALARANGSAVIATVGTSFGALSLAEQAFEVLEDAQVPTSVEE